MVANFRQSPFQRNLTVSSNVLLLVCEPVVTGSLSPSKLCEGGIAFHTVRRKLRRELYFVKTIAARLEEGRAVIR